jgi:hypothetical protein
MPQMPVKPGLHLSTAPAHGHFPQPCASGLVGSVIWQYRELFSRLIQRDGHARGVPGFLSAPSYDQSAYDLFVGTDEFDYEFLGLVARLDAGFESLEPLVKIGSHCASVRSDASTPTSPGHGTSF